MSYVFQTHFSPRSSFSSLLVAICGLLRTISCGGWVYITSSDNHDVHDFMMISYLLLTIPWQLGNILLTPSTVQLAGNKCRKRFSRLFFISIFPLVYFYIQHKVKRVPGAYTYYAFIEWSLIIYDVLYDACTVCDFSNF
ncbi:Frag1/DRAM/Sfk1, partial [Phakopsora pachyrhizi]